MGTVGIVLAAGAGTRYGRPKATVVERGRSWLQIAVQALTDGGCTEVVVVLGADVHARILVEPPTRVVVAEDWEDGLAASLRCGLAAATALEDVDRALVTLVDLPDVDGRVVARLLAAATGPDALVRATYHGVPGHPVVLGRDHWAAVAASAAGDRGAGPYLAERRAAEVECSDLATGQDVDVPR
jgi:CTP:molybdopterin cytidylyltransferase MocA